MSRASELTDLIGSRICHDLISPLGAISNGMELLSMTQSPSPEMELISESIENANARIKFFRIAFGAAGNGQMASSGEISDILAGMAAGGRIRFHWQATGELPRSEVKLAFLLIQCFETAMPWGGEVRIDRTPAEWAISGTSERMQIEPNLWHILSQRGDAAGLEASKVHFALAAVSAAAIGRRLIVESGDDRARVRF